jgi:hypothetical protein
MICFSSGSTKSFIASFLYSPRGPSPPRAAHHFHDASARSMKISPLRLALHRASLVSGGSVPAAPGSARDLVPRSACPRNLRDRKALFPPQPVAQVSIFVRHREALGEDFAQSLALDLLERLAERADQVEEPHVVHATSGALAKHRFGSVAP